MTSPLAERLRALAPQDDDSDWLDVRRRLRRRRRGPVAIAAAAVVAALAVTPAFGLHSTVLDFLSGDPAPAKIRLDFERMGIGAPRGMDPKVIPGQTRRVPLEGDGAEHRLWVAPTSAGGFCFLWENQAGGCRAKREGGAVSVTWLGNQWMERVYGSVISEEGERVELRYADGAVADAPVTWVSPPIDAGFFFVDVPEGHEAPDTRLIEVVLLDGDGEVVERQRAPYRHPLMEDNPDTGLPKAVVYEDRRTLISIATSAGTTVSAVRAPSRLGGHCTWLERDGKLHRAFFGCQTEAQQEALPALGGGLSSGSQPVLFNGLVGRGVETVELRFEDGSSRRIEAVDGVVLAELEPERYVRGRRLVEAVARGPLGKELARHPFDPTAHGVYPCETPIDIGGGQTACP